MLTNSDFRCFDNGGKSADRYTIVPGRQHHRTHMDRWTRCWSAYGCNAEPFHPQGIGMSCEVNMSNGTRHLGKKVKLSTLPPDVVKLARGLFDSAPFQPPL